MNLFKAHGSFHNCSCISVNSTVKPRSDSVLLLHLYSVMHINLHFWWLSVGLGLCHIRHDVLGLSLCHPSLKCLIPLWTGYRDGKRTKKIQIRNWPPTEKSCHEKWKCFCCLTDFQLQSAQGEVCSRPHLTSAPKLPVFLKHVTAFLCTRPAAIWGRAFYVAFAISLRLINQILYSHGCLWVKWSLYTQQQSNIMCFVQSGRCECWQKGRTYTLHDAQRIKSLGLAVSVDDRMELATVDIDFMYLHLKDYTGGDACSVYITYIKSFQKKAEKDLVI